MECASETGSKEKPLFHGVESMDLEAAARGALGAGQLKTSPPAGRQREGPALRGTQSSGPTSGPSPMRTPLL